MKKNNISDIAESMLCCSCGACGWRCPQKAISYMETVGGNLLPKIDSTICTGCGICVSICPGAGLVPALANRLPQDPFSGIALQTYLGKATDQELYANSQSGGIVSALLIHAMETGKIAAAVTTEMIAGNPPRAMARLARSPEEIRRAQKSKYCPVTLLTALTEIENIEKPIAVVGVACQIHGLLNTIEQFPRLKEKIAFTIGLICDRTMTYSAIDFLLKKSGVLYEHKTVLNFRDKSCGGYPGNVNVIHSDGRSKSLSKNIRGQIKDFFTPACCHLCFDKMNVFADITVGDPWGIEKYNSNGESVAIIRTQTGLNIFQDAITKNAVRIREVNYNAVLAGQKIHQKRLEWRGYMEAWKQKGNRLPSYYDAIKNYTSVPFETKKYLQDLQYSLNLDMFPSRNELIDYVEKRLKKKQLINRLLYPARFGKQVIRKLLEFIFRLKK